MRRVRRCGLRVAFVAHTQEFRCSAVRTPLWATHCLRRIRMPKNLGALRCMRRCRPRIACVAAGCRRISLLRSAYAAVGCALPCCIRLPITIAALQCMFFFSIGLLVLIGLCFFYRLETSAPGLSGYYWFFYYHYIQALHRCFGPGIEYHKS